MSGTDSKKLNNEHPITSQTEIEKFLKEIGGKEQVYLIALFDVLGFSYFVEINGNQVSSLRMQTDLLMFVILVIHLLFMLIIVWASKGFGLQIKRRAISVIVRRNRNPSLSCYL